MPAEEVRASHRESAVPGTTLSAVAEPPKDLVRVFFNGIHEGSRLGACVEAMARESLSREKLEISVRALARVLRAVVSGDRGRCSKAPSRRFVELSVQLLVRASPASAREAREKGKLASLGAVTRGGVVWIQGRVRREELARLLGTSDLPIVMASEALAASIMRKAHREDHRRSPQDIAARSRRMVWRRVWKNFRGSRMILEVSQDRQGCSRPRRSSPDHHGPVLPSPRPRQGEEVPLQTAPRDGHWGSEVRGDAASGGARIVGQAG